MQSTLEENDQKLIESQQVSLQIKSLEEKLTRKTIELKEEMEDRDKAEDRVLRLTECLAVKEKELETLRLEVCLILFSYSYENELNENCLFSRRVA